MDTARSSRKADEQAARVREIIRILHKWGIHTLGDLAGLNREEVAQRLGPEGSILWERAAGRSLRPLKLIQPRESYAESFEFEQEVETIEPLLFILRRFLPQIALRLGNTYLVAGEIILRLTFSNKRVYVRHFKIPQPTLDVDLLFRMLYTHLEDFKSEHPIVAVSLEGEPVRSASQQYGLFETALRDPNQLSETLARLTGLLGAERVGTPVLEQTHRPDAFRLEPFSWQLPEASDVPSQDRETGGPWRVALRRFRPPPSASVFLEKNEPVSLSSREIDGVVSASEGPYLASGNWWDENAWDHSEWDVEMTNGAVLRCHENPNGWEVDGIYD